MSGSATQVPHTTAISIILHESNPLTTFCKVTSCLPGHYFEPFSSVVPRFEMRFPLACPVKAEIVSPYCGILINTGVDNPIVSFTQPLEIGEFKASGEALDIHGLYKGIRTPFLHPHLGSSSALFCP